MNTYLNYLLEASIGLTLFLLVYLFLLRKETNFRINRAFLLIAIVASLTFPLIKLNTIDSPVPSLNFSIDSSEISHLTISTNEPVPLTTESEWNLWEMFSVLYAAGLLLFSIVFVWRFIGMMRVLKYSPSYKYNNHHIIELKDSHSPFSFFNYIFIGNTSPLSESEKQQIIEHESIHAKLYHSVDIVLLNLLGIIFWFNPLIRVYKKIFIQLHEFEADARAVEKHDVDEYCSLVAKVALHSANFRLANHFSNSLTIKRIEMMRTLKQKIESWKVITASVMIPLFFFVVACQDQADETQSKIVEETIKYPSNVQQTLDKLKAEFPRDRFIVIPPTGHNPEDFKGHESNISVINGEYVYEANAITVVNSYKKDVSENAAKYLILQYWGSNSLPSKNKSEADAVIEEIPQGDPVFLVVEAPPTYSGGIEKMGAFIAKNLRYPEKAKSEKIEGNVLVSFVIETDGTIQEAKIIKGIDAACDQEALRIVKSFPAWNPGKQNGKAVRTQFITPVKFKL